MSPQTTAEYYQHHTSSNIPATANFWNLHVASDWMVHVLNNSDAPGVQEASVLARTCCPTIDGPMVVINSCGWMGSATAVSTEPFGCCVIDMNCTGFMTCTENGNEYTLSAVRTLRGEHVRH